MNDDALQQIALAREARNQENLIGARAHYAAAAAVYREQNDWLAYAHATRHIADIYSKESELAQARPLYEEVLEIYCGNLDTKVLDLANAIRPYALLNERLGKVLLARELWLEARNLYGSLQIEAGVEECTRRLAMLGES